MSMVRITIYCFILLMNASCAIPVPVKESTVKIPDIETHLPNDFVKDGEDKLAFVILKKSYKSYEINAHVHEEAYILESPVFISNNRYKESLDSEYHSPRWLVTAVYVPYKEGTGTYLTGLIELEELCILSKSGKSVSLNFENGVVASRFKGVVTPELKEALLADFERNINFNETYKHLSTCFLGYSRSIPIKGVGDN